MGHLFEEVTNLAQWHYITPQLKSKK